MTEEVESSGECNLANMAKSSTDVVDYAPSLEMKDSGQVGQQHMKNKNKVLKTNFSSAGDTLEQKQLQQLQRNDLKKTTSDAGVQRSSSSNNLINTNHFNNSHNKNIYLNNLNQKNNKNYKNKNRKQQKVSPNKNFNMDNQQQQHQQEQQQEHDHALDHDHEEEDEEQHLKNLTSDSEEGFLSTSPDSANGETIIMSKTKGKSKNLMKKSASCSLLQEEDHHDPATTSLSNNKDANHSMMSAKNIESLFICTNPQGCLNLHNILDCFKTPLSEEQAWALLYQLVSLYKKTTLSYRNHIYKDLEIPETIDNVNVHRDGGVHFSWSEGVQHLDEQDEDQPEHNSEEERGYYNMVCLIASHKKVIRQVAVIVYQALDFNLQENEQCHISQELEDLFNYMTADENEDDCIDEGIDEGDKRWDDEIDFEKFNETKEFDYVLEACKNHIKPTVPDDHYKAVCRALVTEALELRIFLQQVLDSGANNLHLKVTDSQTSQQELAKLGFTDWARFWVQVIDEMRRGVRLKAVSYSRAPIEFELTPYEILMEDIRSKKYQLRKVMVDGDIPPRVKKDAHAIIMDFIRSRPPLKKASERKLPPPVQQQPSPREQLMISIRNGQTLKHVQPPTPNRLKDRLLLPTTTAVAGATTATNSSAITTNNTTLLSSSTSALQPASASSLASTSASSAPMIPATMTTSSQSLYESLKIQQQMENITPRSKQRLIKCDLLLLQDDDNLFDDFSPASNSKKPSIGVCSQPKMPPYPIGGYLVSDPPAQTTTITKAQQHQQQQHPHQQQQLMRTGDMGTSGGPDSNMPSSLTARVLRRTTYDLATQCESRRASLRRHTIVGCQSNFDEAQSTPSSRPESRQSDMNSIAGTNNISTTKQLHNTYNQQQQMHLKRSQSPNNTRLPSAGGTADNDCYSENETSSNCDRSSSSVGPWNKSFMDEKTWNERGDDRLSLTLEEIVHIRSVMTKAELEALPVGVRVKEDVEKRKVCFLCLRTRFSIFGPWGIQCKLCQRTVCSKCYTKMRIPSEHFRNVPLVLISPSLLASPASSSTPSPSRHVHSSSTGNILDDNFPKTLIERLLSKESEQKARNSVGSAPSSPKHQRSNMSTPGLSSSAAAAHHAAATGQAVEAIHHHHQQDMMTQSYTAGSTHPNNSSVNSHSSILVNGSYAKTQAQNKNFSLMSRSMEGPRSLPANSPARPHSNSSTLDRKSKFSRAFTLSSSGTQLSQEQKENLRGEQVPVCNDCKGLVNEITRSGKQKRSSARNRALQNLTLDLSPVWK